MGLLDGLLDVNNPQTLQALRLLATRKGELGGLLGQFGQEADQRKQREMQEQIQRQQMEARAMEMEQMRRQQADQEQIRGLGQRAFAPNQNLVHGDDEGNSMPSSGGGGLPEFTQGMMGIDPFRGIGLQQQQEAQRLAQAKLNEPKMAFAPNGVAVNMRALQPGQNFEKQPDWMNPAYQDFMMKKAAAGASRVNVDTRQETEFAKAVGKKQGEEYSDLMVSDAQANSKLNKLNRLDSLLASSGNTGKLTPATMELKAVADSLGFKVDSKLPFQQAAAALSNEIALELRNPSGGAGMPGALSDRDREFLQAMVPNVAKTPEGNKILLDTAKKLEQRKKEVAKLAREYRQKTGRFDEGFYQVLSEYSAKHPLFDSGPVQSGDGWSVQEVKR